MTPTQLQAWMRSHNLTKVKAASSIGISRRTLDTYLDGTYPIPLTVELACEAISLRWQKVQ